MNNVFFPRMYSAYLHTHNFHVYTHIYDYEHQFGEWKLELKCYKEWGDAEIEVKQRCGIATYKSKWEEKKLKMCSELS